jgi:2-polyprenyl-6-methoxyphenol hydroxylase-like FAD-dependent oxidoreductase
LHDRLDRDRPHPTLDEQFHGGVDDRGAGAPHPGVDLVAAARRRGRVLAGFAFVADGRHLGDLSAGRLDSAHAYSDLLPQSEIEDILLTHLRGLGVEVQRPLELTGLTQAPGRVEVDLRSADGARSAVRARYVVAADGRTRRRAACWGSPSMAPARRACT